MKAQTDDSPHVVYWHRDLPPLTAQELGEHVVEASSARVSSTLSLRDELWTHCHDDLMARAYSRLEQEVARLGGRYAHVLGESINPHHDDVTSEAWLQGRFTYMLYR